MKAGFQCRRNHGRIVGMVWGTVLAISFFLPFPILVRDKLALLWSWDVFSGAEQVFGPRGLPDVRGLLDFLRLVFAVQLVGGPVCIVVSQIPNRLFRFVFMGAASAIPASLLAWRAGELFGGFQRMLRSGVHPFGQRVGERVLGELARFADLWGYYFAWWFLAPVSLLLILLWGWRDDSRNPTRIVLTALCAVAVAAAYFVPLSGRDSFFLQVVGWIHGPLGWVQLLHFAPLALATLSLLTVLRAASRRRQLAKEGGGGRLLAAAGIAALLFLPAAFSAGVINYGLESYLEHSAQSLELRGLEVADVPLVALASIIFLAVFLGGIVSRWLPFLFVSGSALNGLLSFRPRSRRPPPQRD